MNPVSTASPSNGSAAAPDEPRPGDKPQASRRDTERFDRALQDAARRTSSGGCGAHGEENEPTTAQPSADAAAMVRAAPTFTLPPTSTAADSLAVQAAGSTQVADAWMHTLRQLHAPADSNGVQHWQFQFAEGTGPLQSLTLQAQPGAPWALQVRTAASHTTRSEHDALGEQMDSLHERLLRRGARVSNITLEDDSLAP